ncbi:MAG: VPLPA-CTERM sorting domain-containing protein [Tateyamaria sp.]|jgi:hypothetical protein|uniref:VPLPA-CTERM sorting domain-containing protein n=3 Tax=Tateyamaria sp. TaxID=1929288 RepID=UPI0032DDD372
MKKLFLSALIAGGIAATSGAAATFNFDDLADADPPGAETKNEGSWQSRVTADYGALGVFDGTLGFGNTLTVAGISVVATGGSYDPTVAVGDRVNKGDTSAYLDKGNAGLGAARTSSLNGTGNTQANPSNDDNTGISGGSLSTTGFFEYLTLTFSESVFIKAMSFDNDGHARITDGTVGFNQDGGLTFSALDISASVNDYTSKGSSNVWTFAKISNGSNFYINTMTVESDPTTRTNPVPVPAALPLMLVGVGGLGFMARRKRKAA